MTDRTGGEAAVLRGIARGVLFSSLAECEGTVMTALPFPDGSGRLLILGVVAPEADGTMAVPESFRPAARKPPAGNSNLDNDDEPGRPPAGGILDLLVFLRDHPDSCWTDIADAMQEKGHSERSVTRWLAHKWVQATGQGQARRYRIKSTL